jgi:hypothetical protein
MQINAIATAPTNIQAALASPEVRAVAKLLAAADIAITKPLSIAELDTMLAGKGLRTSDRIQLKSALSRAGILK